MSISDADDYDNLSDFYASTLKNKIKALSVAIASKLEDEIEDTAYADTDITAKIADNDHSSYYVIFDGDSYPFNW